MCLMVSGLIQSHGKWGPRHCCKVSLNRWLGRVVRIRVDGFRYPMRRSMGFFPPPSSAFIGWQIVNIKSWHPWVLIGLYWLFLRMFFFLISTRRSTSDSFPHVSCVCQSERGYNSIHFTMFHNSIHFTLVNFVLWTVNSSATFFGCFFP